MVFIESYVDPQGIGDDLKQAITPDKMKEPLAAGMHLQHGTESSENCLRS